MLTGHLKDNTFPEISYESVCPKQADLSILISEASKEFSQVTHLENFIF